MMKNGLPFTTELWEYENIKNVVFYLPVIEEFFNVDEDNGYGFILKDSADNEFFCFTFSLQHEGKDTAFTPLKWIPFKKKINLQRYI